MDRKRGSGGGEGRRLQQLLLLKALGWALAGALSLPLGCGPQPIVVVQETPRREEGAVPPEDRLPVRAPAQIAGDPTGEDDPRPPERVAANNCDFEPRIASIGRGCERLRGTSATGTGVDQAAIAAFDGDLCTTWSSGGMAPQSATLDLGAATQVSTIVLVPQMVPARATVRHSVETSDDGRTFQRLGELNLPMTSGELVELPIPNGVTTRFIRVVTLESPAQVAWRDIAILRCGGGRRR